MPLEPLIFQNKEYQIVMPNKAHEEGYRKRLSVILNRRYGQHICEESILSALEDSFSFYEVEIERVLTDVRDLTFYFFVYNLHEQSAELSYYLSQGHSIPLDTQYFASYRRILKIILQQSCFVSLEHGKHPDTNWMISTVDKIEELIYLSQFAMDMVNSISEQKITKGSLKITFEDGLVVFGQKKYWGEFLTVFHENFQVQVNSSIGSDRIEDIFNKEIKSEFGIGLDELNAIFYHIDEKLYNEIPPKFCTVKELITIFEKQSKSAHIVEFINGLKLTRDNCATIKSGIYTPYKGNRIINRPLLSIDIDGTECILCSPYSFLESVNTLFQNNISLGKIPSEWELIPVVKKLRTRLSGLHKDILEDPVEDLLKSFDVKYDRNVKSLLSKQHYNNLSINNNPGEIDFIFLLNNTIYVVDCKNLTKRYEMHGYYQDLSKFIPYDLKMDEKIKFLNDNKTRLFEHLQIKFDQPTADFDQFKIVGIFILNTPTLCMINGTYKMYSFHYFKQLIEDDLDFFDGEVAMPDSGNTKISWPFIDNFNQYFNKHY